MWRANAPLTRPRPGHADYAGMLKYGFDDARPVLERASARETAARVAAGTIARQFLRQALGVEVVSHIISIGASEPYAGPPPAPADLAAIDDSPVRAFDEKAQESDDRRDRGRQEGRRHARRRGRGRRARTSRRARIVHQRGQPAGQPTRGRGDGHPGHQGCRDRRRFRDRAPPRQPGPRRDVPRAGRRGALHQPRRRPGGRHDQRPTAAGAGGDEAHLDRAARAGDRRHGHRRRSGGDPPALRCVRGARCRRGGRGDGGAGAGTRRAGEVRRRLAGRDPSQCRRVPAYGGRSGTGADDGRRGRRDS